MINVLRTRRRASVLACLALCAAAAVPRGADAKARERKKDESEEVDYLALGARLVADGHYDRAAAVLREIDPKDEKVDRPRLHFLLGTVYLKKELYAQARDEFQASVKAGQQSPAIYLYLAQAQFHLRDYRGVLSALDRAGAAATENPGVYAMRAESHFLLEDPRKAIAALNEGQRRFPDFVKLSQMKLGYLLDLGLYQEVVEVGEVYLSRQDVKPDDFVAVAEGLRKSKQLNEARIVMERAHLRFPENELTAVQLANIYNDMGQPLTAAMLYEQTSRGTPKYSFEAAELYKNSGRASRALSINARILDAQKKLKQRLAILLEMERFEMIAAMEPSLSRAGLLKDESIRYALAYGYYKNGDFDSAEQHLKQLSDSALFEKATALRKAMATCREAGWACY